MSARTYRHAGPGPTTGIALVAALLFAVPAAADYKEQYRKGLLALDAKNYAEAIRALRQATDENPLEGGDTIAISGSRNEPYVPLYYIGLAYYRMGDCGKAGVTWQLAKMGGEVLDYPALARAMKENLAACEGGKAGKGAEPTAEAPAEAAPAAAPGASPRIRNLLQGARADLAGKRYARAKQRAEEALDLGADQAEVDRLLADVVDAERAAVAVPAAPPGATAAPAAAAAEAERQAMEAFFGMDYERSRALLAPLAGQSLLTPRGYLYLACSYAAEAVLTGRDVDATMRRARDVFQRAQAGGGKFDADWKFISPRLRALVEGRAQP